MVVNPDDKFMCRCKEKEFCPVHEPQKVDAAYERERDKIADLTQTITEMEQLEIEKEQLMAGLRALEEEQIDIAAEMAAREAQGME